MSIIGIWLKAGCSVSRVHSHRCLSSAITGKASSAKTNWSDAGASGWHSSPQSSSQEGTVCSRKR